MDGDWESRDGPISFLAAKLDVATPLADHLKPGFSQRTH